MRYFALLRAINVGGHVVKMERLRALFGELGFGDVATFIASGNLIFESDEDGPAELETRIETHLRAALGYDVATFIRTCPELRAISTHAAQSAANEGTLYVGLLKSAPAKQALRELQELATGSDELSVRGRELYWRALEGMGRSRVTGAQLEKRLGPVTARNINTINNLLDKFC